MKLETYLQRKRLTTGQFGRRIGVSPQAVWRYVVGQRRPEWEVIQKITEATRGAVTANDFMDGKSESKKQ